jgi:hypothetical protein
MATIFPLDPEINDEFDGYRWDGVAWKIIGINFTKEYVEENDSRLTNERVPTDNSVSTAKIIDGTILDEDVSASANISQSKINGLTSDLSNKASASALTDHVSSSAGVHGIINSASLVYTNDLDLYLTQASASSLYATISQLSASVSEIQNVLLTKMPYSYASASPTNPVPGETWFDSSASASSAIPYFYDGNTDEFVQYGNIPPNAVEYLVVAAGGGGGGRASFTTTGSGGGGAGGYRTDLLAVDSSTTYTVTIGGGGAGGADTGSAADGDGLNGSNSVFSTITANGGGGGGNFGRVGLAGGSGGGGGGRSSTAGGAGNTPSVSPSQGNSGGNANPSTVGGTGAGGGGGGATASGSNGQNVSNGQGGDGGAGTASSISGTSVTYAGGGGGGGISTKGVGGAGGGGNGGDASDIPTNGQANRGGGGGGARATTGGNGGSGVVIIRYPNTFKDAITSGNPIFNPNANGYKVYTFNDSGTIAW